ncbi:MAG: carboxypeptidase regulatory-like domain-containing protein [Planctomycetes bacterium]|nr:carboxypeptidase regulatory-like domain-containing protein [Planctomycetota bacterium]
MKKITRVLCLVSAAAVLCLSARPAAAAKYEVVDVKDGGSIVGVVKWDGEIPKRHRLKITHPDKPCHTKPIPNDDLVVSKDARVRWVVAYIKKIDQGKPFDIDPDNPITLDQKGCRFRPHIVVVPKDVPLRILNSDGVLHNVHLFAKKNEPFNRSMPGRVKELSVTFDYKERIRVGCDVHKWMSGWIVVSKHPYYAVTGKDGAFRFDNVPAGSYSVEIWHEKLGKKQVAVTVTPGGESLVEFVLEKK